MARLALALRARTRSGAGRFAPDCRRFASAYHCISIAVFQFSAVCYPSPWMLTWFLFLFILPVKCPQFRASLALVAAGSTFSAPSKRQANPPGLTTKTSTAAVCSAEATTLSPVLAVAVLSLALAVSVKSDPQRQTTP